MSNRRHIAGNELIQSDEISSSSEVVPFNCAVCGSQRNHRSRFPLARPSYRIIHPTDNSLNLYRPLLRFADRGFPIIPNRSRNLTNENRNNLPPNMSILVPAIPRSPGSFPISDTNGIDTLSTRTALLCVGLIFLSSLILLSFVYGSFPQLSKEEIKHIKVPWNIGQAKQLGIVLNRYKDDNYFQVLGGVFITYIFLQTFAIPGSLFLSILSGFLFPFYAALILVCTCSTIGASLCFVLSQLLGRKLVLTYFPEKAKNWSVIVNKQRGNLFNYVVFLRITPFLPNWFINLTAPVIGVPLEPFAVGTFVGVAPPSFVAIQAGQTLHQMTANDVAFSWTSITLLCVFAVISLIPIFLKEKFKAKFD